MHSILFIHSFSWAFGLFPPFGACKVLWTVVCSCVWVPAFWSSGSVTPKWNYPTVCHSSCTIYRSAFLSYAFVSQASWCLLGRIVSFLEALEENAPLSREVLEAVCIPWLMAPSFIFKAISITFLSLSYFCLHLKRTLRIILVPPG